MSSSRPVKDTGWNEIALILSMFSAAKRMIGTTSSLLIVFTIVVTSVTSMPALFRFSIARSLTSKRLPTLRCELASLVVPSNWR